MNYIPGIPDKKGQIGPMSLESILPLTVMIIITLILLVLIIKAVGGYLEISRGEDMYDGATELLGVIESRSTVVYGKTPGILDETKFDDFDITAYKLAEYECEIEIEDLVSGNGKSWSSSCFPENKTRISSVSPIAIHTNSGEIHEGLLKVFVWKE